MSQELNDYIEDLDIYIFELNDGQLVVAEVIDVQDKNLKLNYALSLKDKHSFTPYGTAIIQILPSTSVRIASEASSLIKHAYFKYNLVRKIVSSGGLTQQELFEFELILDEEPKHFTIDKKFESKLNPFFKNQRRDLN